MNIPKLTQIILIAIFVFCTGVTNLLAGDSLSAKGEVIKVTRASGLVEFGSLFDTTASIGFNRYLYVKDESGKEIRFYLESATKYKGMKEGEDIKTGDIVVVNYYTANKPYITDEGKGALMRLNTATLVDVVSSAKQSEK